MDLEKIEKLNELKEKGMITQEEYDKAKTKALGGDVPATASVDMDNRTYSMLMHFAQLCGYLLLMCGWIAPLVMWLIRRDDPYINEQGKVVFNWIISSFIYFMICFVLWLIFIGIFLTIALGVISIIFTVIGAIRAKDGVIQNYPMSISFFTVDPSVGAPAE
ncbi:DUF4870 domain-containing protein [Gilvimarinus sp. SDUM040013]|uniref:DUF4870 domain-containing protein n=1 Tax=Gilvimarinus gilvus TaxID=3058038 RepID=A0ABU4S4B0_9GAMM|nr:DUF4870 domain-containing protein [Gilvimarinus sp. SDUM040013]MDO3386891.1 DUF4870 domain-containing protein [Gilvimarinus sp. SDUM040013]MDX6851342.1 DUF4870 domain-containing protein [Gilvimarinus sp. SDUM040013]